MADDLPPSRQPPEDPLDWARRSGVSGRLIADVDRLVTARRRRLRRAAGAASLALLLGAGIWFAGMPPAPAADSAATVVVRPPSRTLPDGSVVELNGGAAIAVFFTGDTRQVELSGGAAHFTVSPDPGRPFVVRSGNVEARAVGTAFAVALSGEQIAILVTHGRVAVSRQPSARETPPPTTVVDAGTGVRVDRAAAATQPPRIVPAAEMSVLLAWRVPRLEFSDTPLAEAIAMFNEHGSARLALVDASLGSLRVSGILRADDTASLLRLLEADFGLRAEEKAGIWQIRRK